MFINFKKIVLFFILFIFSGYVYACAVYDFNDVKNILGHEELNNIYEKAKNGDEKFQYILGLIYTRGVNLGSIQQEPDTEKGRYWLEKASDNGVANASAVLSEIYRQGLDVDKNMEKSLSLLKKSASCGYADAQYELAKMYFDKNNNFFSLKKAAYWYEKAAENGILRAIPQIAIFYESGTGVDQSDSKAFYWYKKGVSKNEIFSISKIAPMYEKGVGTEKNLIMAYMMYDLLGSAGADDKKRISKNMTSDQIHEAVEKSRSWQEEHESFVPSYYGIEQ